MLRVSALLSLLTFTACDTGTLPLEENGGPNPPTPNGTLTGFLNGEPYEAPATYRRGSNGYLLLNAQRVGPPPSYRTYSVSFVYLADPFEEGATLPLLTRDEGNRNGLLMGELLGDAAVNFWRPVEGMGDSLRVVEADSTTGRFRAVFEATVVAVEPVVEPYQTLPDTIRFTQGEFVVDLNASTE